MSSHARRCFSFAKMLKCVVGFPILRDLNCIETSHNVVPVVQKLDDTAVDDTAGLSPPPPPSPVYHFPLDNAIDFPNTYPPDSALSGGWHYLNYWSQIVTYQVEFLNSWSTSYCIVQKMDTLLFLSTE